MAYPVYSQDITGKIMPFGDDSPNPYHLSSDVMGGGHDQIHPDPMKKRLKQMASRRVLP